MGPGLTIGAVLSALKDEFPDLSVSKVRYLDAEGLVSPKRSESGYRRYSQDDVERLRFVLRAQRDRFWPLKVIREALDAYDRGLTPQLDAPGDLPTSAVPVVPAPQVDPDVPAPEELLAQPDALSLTATELCRGAGCDDAFLRDLETFGLVRPDATGHYDAAALQIATAAVQLSEFGVQARHLRGFKLAADREVSLVQQLPHREESDAAVIAQRCLALHVALVKSGMRL